MFERLSKNNFKIELKSLPLGDFLWVLRVHHPHAGLTAAATQNKLKKKKAAPVLWTDYVLDFIVERKTADDLAASIMDGRYDE